MGYDLHIVRLDNYDDGDEESKISLEEWLAYVATDKELELTNGYETIMPGFDSDWQNRPGFCNWLGHPNGYGSAVPWFDFGGGSISTKNPDKYIIKKMLQIAVSLDARVCGDDGEYYDQTYFTNGGYPITEQQSVVKAGSHTDHPVKKPWWKIW